MWIIDRVVKRILILYLKSYLMGNCSFCSTENEGKSNIKKIDEVELEKKDIDLFNATQDANGNINFRDLFTTAPAIKIAKVKINDWLSQNNEITLFSKSQWSTDDIIACEICQYSYKDAQELMDEQDPCSYSYWKGIDIRDQLIGEELTIMKYTKNETLTKGICAGCFFRSDELKNFECQ